MTKLDIPEGENTMVKEFKASLERERECLESLTIHGECIDGAYVSYFMLHENIIKKTLSVSIYSFSREKILVLGGMSLGLELP